MQMLTSELPLHIDSRIMQHLNGKKLLKAAL